MDFPPPPAANETWYHGCSPGLLLPVLNEGGWHWATRAVLYFAGLVYCFLGIAIIADVFMCSIEKITSKTRKITLSAQVPTGEADVIEVKVWNETVANLTLMALGSSAPEILLSIIEIVGNGFRAGDLGPGTIVGSAAFNLLVICGVCVMAIPEGQVRRIRLIKVFAVTASFSIFAYVWLLVVLVLISPDIIELWEGLLTLLFFFLLILLAYLADKGILLPGRKKEEINEQKQIELKTPDDPEKAKDSVAAPKGTDSHKKQFFQDGRIDRPSVLEFIRETRKHPGLTLEDCAALAAARLADEQSHSRAWYRVQAIRDFTGGRRTKPSISAQLQEKLDQEVRELCAVADTVDGNRTASTADAAAADGKKKAQSAAVVAGSQTKRAAGEDALMNGLQRGTVLSPLPAFIDRQMAYVEFNASQVCVLEKSRRATVLLRRRGNVDSEIGVRVETIDGTAIAHEDYRPIRQLVKFASGEVVKAVTVELIDDQQWEPDESFFLRLSIPLPQRGVRLARKSVMEVVIINDDEPGQFQFLRRGILVKESVGVASLPVVRRGGCDGSASVCWRTKDQTAVNRKDFVGGEGKLVFEDGETEKAIEIEIIDDLEAEKDEHFEVELFEPSEGSSLGAHTRCTVTIANDDEFASIVNRITMMANLNVDKMRLHRDSWTDQIRDNLNVNGGALESASAFDYFAHSVTFGWKLLFSLVPPPSFAGGWITFFVSLTLIGLLTAVVADLASTFGCLVGLKDTVTAITFVALGTSLPDLFASRTAAIQERYADNAVGNVTGSNSVNVFLGLGLPWLLAAAYWAARDDYFRVEAGTLGFSVGIYCAVALCCIALLLARRYLHPFGHGELGGPRRPAILSALFMFFLWIIYILLSALKAYGHI